MKAGDAQYVEREHWHGGKVVRNWLAANPVPSSKASVQAPLFQGTLVFVQMTFTRPNQLPFSMLAADIQTAVTYATLAVGPIQRYAWQYGPNSVQVSPNILSFTANLQGNTFSDDDLQGWVDSIVQDNNLTNACVVILHELSECKQSYKHRRPQWD